MSYLINPYKVTTPIPAQTLCEGQTTDSAATFSEISYKQITGCTAGNTLVSCSVDFYNLTDVNLKYGAYSDSSNLPDQLLAHGEITNQTIVNTYTTLTMTFSTIISPVPADGIVWVAVIPSKSGQGLRTTANPPSSYLNSVYASDGVTPSGNWDNYDNNLYSSAPVQGVGGNSYRMCLTA